MSQPEQQEYDDAYPTCAATYSTLRVFSDRIEPQDVSEALGIEPTSSFRKGEPHGRGLQRKSHGWFYSTERLSSSRDTRRHIDLLLAVLEGKAGVLERLQAQGCELDIVSYWVSNGQGGPELTPHQMLKLGTLGIRVWWDIYFAGKDET